MRDDFNSKSFPSRHSQNKAPGIEAQRDGKTARGPLAMQRDFPFVFE
jgi:hypothetical protein